MTILAISSLGGDFEKNLKEDFMKKEGKRGKRRKKKKKMIKHMLKYFYEA